MTTMTRRDFIGASAAGIGACGLSSGSEAVASSRSTELPSGWHTRALLPDCALPVQDHGDQRG
jgi:hypothetical protein